MVFPFPFHALIPLINLLFIRLQGPTLRTISYVYLYPLIRPPRRPLALGRGRIRIPGLIWSPPMLAIYNNAHSLPLGRVERDFPFNEDETRRHFPCLSGTLRHPVKKNYINYLLLDTICRLILKCLSL